MVSYAAVPSWARAAGLHADRRPHRPAETHRPFWMTAPHRPEIRVEQEDATIVGIVAGQRNATIPDLVDRST